MTQTLAVPSQTDMIDDFRIMLPYAPEGEAAFDERPRISALATISAGRRNDKGLPERSRDGRIFVHGNAPGLVAELAKRDYRSLTIMFMDDDPQRFIEQRYVQYSKTSLLAYGDDKMLTLFTPEGRKEVHAGSIEYARAVEGCKTYFSVYFTLAQWFEDGSAGTLFPDGLGCYRLRTTSANSIRSILAQCRHMTTFTRGRIAAIPFDLFIEEEEHSDGRGQKQRVPIWQLVTRPPQGFRLSSRELRHMIDKSAEERQLLQLMPAPTPTSAEDMQSDIHDGAVVDDEDAEIEVTGICDAEFYRAKWFATVRGTHLDTDAARHQFIANLTGGLETSLAGYLNTASEKLARTLIDAAEAAIELKRVQERQSEYLPPQPAPAPAPAPAPVAARTPAPAPAPAPPRPAVMPDSSETGDATRAELEEAITRHDLAVMRASNEGRVIRAVDIDRLSYAEIVSRTRKILSGLGLDPNIATDQIYHTPTPAAETPPPASIRDAIAQRNPHDPEGEEIFEQPEIAEEPQSGSAPLAPCTVKLLQGLAAAGHDTGGDLLDEAVLAGINAWYYRINNDSPGLEVDSLDEIPADDVPKILQALSDGLLTIPAPAAAGVAADA